jgi:hypothetical protein
MGTERARLRAPSLGCAWPAVVLLACGCAAPPAAVVAAGTSGAASGLARYLPLEDGTVLSYDTVTEPGGERGLLVLEIRRPNAETAELVVAGKAQRLRVSESAVATYAGGILLREPLEAGAGWKGDFGHVRLVRTDRSLTVGAGTFSACVETLEEMATRDGEKRTTTVYCPGVGIALRETEAEQGAVHQSERISLKSYGPKFSPAAP